MSYNIFPAKWVLSIMSCSETSNVVCYIPCESNLVASITTSQESYLLRQFFLKSNVRTIFVMIFIKPSSF